MLRHPARRVGPSVSPALLIADGVLAGHLMLDFIAMLGAATTFSDVALSFLVNAAILIYVLLPGTKAAFGISQT
jgi:hypothetical protein